MRQERSELIECFASLIPTALATPATVRPDSTKSITFRKNSGSYSTPSHTTVFFEIEWHKNPENLPENPGHTNSSGKWGSSTVLVAPLQGAFCRFDDLLISSASAKVS